LVVFIKGESRKKEEVMKYFGLIVVALFLMGAAVAYADSDLTGAATTDNVYHLFLSNNPLSLGTYIMSSQISTPLNPGAAYDWQSAESISASLNGNNYLHVVGWDQGSVAGFLGSFTLNNGNTFDGGANTLKTGDSGWTVHNIAYDPGTYSGAFGGDLTQYLQNLGNNGVDPWKTINGIGSAQWMWTVGTPNVPQGTLSGITTDVGGATAPLYRVFTAKMNVVPEPISTTLFLLGGGALAVRRFRRKA
jgi:hypothetical protein